MQASLDELREMARRSRRTQRAAWLALLVALLAIPVIAWAPSERLAFALTLAGGAAMVNYAWRAGEERGAYRRLFKDLKNRSRSAP